MINLIENKINLCEASSMYIDAEFYRNILRQFLKLSLVDFIKLLDFNIANSNEYFLTSLLELRNKLGNEIEICGFIN